MRLSSIDIGTNTILLLIADVEAPGAIRVVRDVHSIARLGRGVDKTRAIAGRSFNRALKFLKDYKRISEELHCDRIIACGTSALRDTTNRKKFLLYVKSKLGIEIRVLSGEEEAELTYRGAVSEFVKRNDQRSFAVLDIGGGSTELTLGAGSAYEARKSLDIGSVRLTERFLKHSPPTPDEIAEARSEIHHHISAFTLLPPESVLIGVAGTLTTLAALDLKLTTFDSSRVSGHILRKDSVERIFFELQRKTLRAIESYQQIVKGRGDIILAGILILLEVLDHLKRDAITVSDRGLRYGLLLDAADKMRLRKPRKHKDLAELK